MGVYMVGSGSSQAPFSRTFFNVTLGDILQRSPKDKHARLLLYLADGATLDVCAIDELADDYLVVRAYGANEAACELSINLIPYTLIYRLEIAPKEDETSGRLGFRWSPPAARKGTSVRRPAK